MKTTVRVLVVVLLIGVAVGVGLFVSRNTEDKTHATGLETVLDNLNSKIPEIRTQAQQDLRSRGTNALPGLLALLQGQTAGGGSRQETADKKSQLGGVMERNRLGRLAARGFEVLGETASPAVPTLTELIVDTNCTVYAARCLALTGAVEPLAKALGSDDAMIRMGAASALGYAKEPAQPAVSGLIRLLQDAHDPVRVAAAEALGKIGLEPAQAVPALMECLRNPNAAVRTAAADALGKFKKAAKPAVSALQQASQDSVREVRRAARRALESIQGK